MKLPDRFILAFPRGANKYIYYNAYWVDMVAKTITYTSDDYHGGCLMCRTQFDKEKHLSINLTKNRIIGKQPQHVREFIHNGVYSGMSWFHARMNEDRHLQKCQIRFEPYSANFVDGDFIQWDKNEKLHEIHEKLYDPFWGKDLVYDVPFSEWEDCESLLTQAYQAMAYSQVRFKIDKREIASKKIKSLKDIYEPLLDTLIHMYSYNSNTSYSENMVLIEKIFPPKGSKSAKKAREVIQSSVHRFVRRHPTLATTNLLKMIAGLSGLAKSGPRFAGKSPLPLAS